MFGLEQIDFVAAVKPTTPIPVKMPDRQQRQILDRATARFLTAYEQSAKTAATAAHAAKVLVEQFTESLSPAAIAAIKSDAQKRALYAAAYEANIAAQKMFEAAQKLKRLG
jgi:hypothetical protein